MFTGVVRLRGSLIDEPRRSEHGGVLLRIGHDAALSEELEAGARLAVSGVGLTVAEMESGVVVVELSPEVLRRTTLGELQRGSAVNLEPAMRLGDALGGHWVQGHVDDTTEVLSRRDLDDRRELSFLLPAGLRAFVVEKGSVTVDGVSLTVSGTNEDAFSVAVTPPVLEATTLALLSRDDRANLEVDVLGKYVHRALETAGVIPG